MCDLAEIKPENLRKEIGQFQKLANMHCFYFLFSKWRSTTLHELLKENIKEARYLFLINMSITKIRQGETTIIGGADFVMFF